MIPLTSHRRETRMDSGRPDGRDPVPDDNSRRAGGVQGTYLRSRNTGGPGDAARRRTETKREIMRRSNEQFSIRRRYQPRDEHRQHLARQKSARAQSYGENSRSTVQIRECRTVIHNAASSRQT